MSLRMPLISHWPEVVIWHSSLQGWLGEQESSKVEKIVTVRPIMIHFLELVYSLPKHIPELWSC